MQNQYEKDSSVDFAWNVKNVKGRKNDMGKKSKGKRNLFIAVVIAIVFLGIVSIVISGTTMYHFLEKYLEQASKSGTDVILGESGISGLIDWISEKETVPADILISDLDADLSEKGGVYSFTLSIQEFDDKNEYVKDILYIYDSERKELNVKEDINRITKTQYDPNAEVDYLDSQMKRIPFIAQMKALDFERYKVQYRQDGRLEAGMPVIDGRDQEAFPILTWDEYMQGAGGVSDGSSQVVIALTNGSVINGNASGIHVLRKMRRLCLEILKPLCRQIISFFRMDCFLRMTAEKPGFRVGLQKNRLKVRRKCMEKETYFLKIVFIQTEMVCLLCFGERFQFYICRKMTVRRGRTLNLQKIILDSVNQELSVFSIRRMAM